MKQVSREGAGLNIQMATDCWPPGTMVKGQGDTAPTSLRKASFRCQVSLLDLPSATHPPLLGRT